MSALPDPHHLRGFGGALAATLVGAGLSPRLDATRDGSPVPRLGNLRAHIEGLGGGGGDDGGLEIGGIEAEVISSEAVYIYIYIHIYTYRSCVCVAESGGQTLVVCSLTGDAPAAWWRFGQEREKRYW